MVLPKPDALRVALPKPGALRVALPRPDALRVASKATRVLGRIQGRPVHRVEWPFHWY
jgi:hypothetical protein